MAPTTYAPYPGTEIRAEHGGGPKEIERRLVQLAATAIAALEWEAKRQ